MKKTLTTAALVLALCCPVFAGEIHTPAPAPPPPSIEQQEQTADGHIHNDVPASLTEVVLSVIESVLALL